MNLIYDDDQLLVLSLMMVMQLMAVEGGSSCIMYQQRMRGRVAGCLGVTEAEASVTLATWRRDHVKECHYQVCTTPQIAIVGQHLAYRSRQ